MEQKIIEKITRFLYLVNKFEQTEDMLFDENLLNKIVKGNTLAFAGTGHTVHFNNDAQHSSTIDSYSIEEQKVTKAMIIKEKAEQEILLANEYDEYIELKEDLNKYFEIINKLNK